MFEKVAPQSVWFSWLNKSRLGAFLILRLDAVTRVYLYRGLFICTYLQKHSQSPAARIGHVELSYSRNSIYYRWENDTAGISSQVLLGGHSYSKVVFSSNTEIAMFSSCRFDVQPRYESNNATT